MMLPFWQLTSEQDWDLCERNHAGIRNQATSSRLVDWYVNSMPR
jgi:hypothetical protein